MTDFYPNLAESLLIINCIWRPPPHYYTIWLSTKSLTKDQLCLKMHCLCNMIDLIKMLIHLACLFLSLFCLILTITWKNPQDKLFEDGGCWKGQSRLWLLNQVLTHVTVEMRSAHTTFKKKMPQIAHKQNMFHLPSNLGLIWGCSKNDPFCHVVSGIAVCTPQRVTHPVIVSTCSRC